MRIRTTRLLQDPKLQVCPPTARYSEKRTPIRFNERFALVSQTENGKALVRQGEMVRRLMNQRKPVHRRGRYGTGGSSKWRYVRLALIWARQPFTL